VTFVGTSMSNYIKLGGNLNLGDNVLFSGSSQSIFWKGLVLSSANVVDNINHAYFRNCDLDIYRSNFEIHFTDFSNSQLIIHESTVGVYNCNFYSSNLTIEDSGGLANDTNLKLYQSLFDGPNQFSSYSIELESVYKYVIKDNIIRNGRFGINIRNSGDSNERCIALNKITDHRSVGLTLHDSNSEIIDANEIERNQIGILASGHGDIELYGNTHPPYQKISDNRECQVASACTTFPEPFKYNIITGNNGNNLVVCIGHSGLPHIISSNYWGGLFNPTQAFEPFGGFYWNSQWFPAKSEIIEDLPKSYFLEQNYPNPFNPSTKIEFSLLTDSSVELVIFNSKGEVVKELINTPQLAGVHVVDFDGSNLNSGIYFYRLSVDGESISKKMILTK
jgi:hypothetical protein